MRLTEIPGFGIVLLPDDINRVRMKDGSWQPISEASPDDIASLRGLMLLGNGQVCPMKRATQ